MLVAKNKTVISKKDVFKMQQLSILKSLWIVCIVAAALVLLAFRIKNGSFVFESVFFAVVGGATIPVYVCILEIMILVQNKKLPKQMTFEYEITDSAILAKAFDGTNQETLEVKLSSIKKYIFGKKYITIMVDKNSSLTIAQSGFEKPEDSEQFKRLLELKSSKKHKSSHSKK